MSETEDICSRCPHPFDPHTLLTFGPPSENHPSKLAGIILCQEEGCGCISTWSIDGEPRPPIEEVAELLRMVASLRGQGDEWVQAMTSRLYLVD